jgi:hypothetical protein
MEEQQGDHDYHQVDESRRRFGSAGKSHFAKELRLCEFVDRKSRELTEDPRNHEEASAIAKQMRADDRICSIGGYGRLPFRREPINSSTSW